MKKIALAALFIIGVISVKAQDVTVDQILDTYFENVGGREAWSKVEGYSMKANVDAQGMTIPIDMVNLKDGRMVTKFTFQGKEFVQQAFDGETTWSVSFMTMKAEKGESEDTENYKRTISEFPDALLKHKENGYTIELDGEDTKDGVDCYKLKVTKKTQLVEGEEKENIVYYYMDKENFVPIMQEQEMMSGQMKGQIAQTLFSDYQEVEGLYFPFSMTYQTEGGGGQTIQVESMKLNPEVDDSIFMFPAEEVTEEGEEK
jgi:outer membrane lipoprotein-sorting protein